jgi:hypothetical protein
LNEGRGTFDSLTDLLNLLGWLASALPRLLRGACRERPRISQLPGVGLAAVRKPPSDSPDLLSFPYNDHGRETQCRG